ncbi:LacI family DNA-binding transcriptional regulator [Ileibacterium valens]|uniref:LacI family DNA-binding transcriptional regulator n=1 Tax=Ileibacterium valens TaxID=1862668 RepID=UPI0023576C80|nr:LacI family DNA-binding transcriptional regulator [Ileibacterium valens]
MAKKITIKEIARESGYSIGTVSRTLNQMPGVSEEARETIMQIVRKYNFELNTNAKFLKQRNRSGIMILVRGNNNMLFADLLEKMQMLITEKGYDPLIYYISEDQDEVEETLKFCRIRSPMGIMFLGSTREHFRKNFQKITIPCVLVTNSAMGLPFNNLSSVTTNDSAAAQFAVEYLFSLGHEHIGIIGGSLSDSQAAKSRYQGAQYAFYNRQIPFNFEKQYVENYFTIEGGYQAMKELLAKIPEITAVFAMSDVSALGAIRAIADSGKRVPEDIAVVGFDGLKITQFTIPRLTTIRQNTDELARRSVEVLCKTIEELCPPVYEEISFSFAKGESTAPVEGYLVKEIITEETMLDMDETVKTTVNTHSSKTDQCPEKNSEKAEMKTEECFA